MKDKEITFKIKEQFMVTGSKDDDFGTFIGVVEWNGNESKGIDIRNYDKRKKKLYKGITIKCEDIDDIVDCLVGMGYGNKLREVDADDIKTIDEPVQLLGDRKLSVFSMDDFEHMFKNVHSEVKYTRDEYGFLRNKKGNCVILPRNKNKGA